MHMLPGTRLGKWSMGLIIAFLLLFFLMALLGGVFGERGGATFSSNLLLAIPGFTAGICAIGAFITGAIAVFHRKETAVLVYVSMAVGLAVTLFVAGEFAFPH